MNPGRTTCRICCSNDSLLLDIFGSEAQKVTYFEDIDTCLSLKVGKDDGLPQVICVKCAGKLSECTPYVNKVRLVHSQKKQKRSRISHDVCSHCGETRNYLFQIPPESVSKVETCFNRHVLDKEQICHRCQFHLETLYELQVKSRDTQKNFLNKKLPLKEAHTQKEETVGSMVKSLSKKFLSKMKKSKFSNQTSLNSPLSSIADESCSEVSSTVRDESLDSSDDDAPLASFRHSSTPSSQKEAVISNGESSKLKRRSSSENVNHNTDSEISLKRSKQSAHPKHRFYHDNQDTLEKKSLRRSPTKLISEKNDGQVSKNSTFDDRVIKKKSPKASPKKRIHSGMNDSQDSSSGKTEDGTSSPDTHSAARLPKNKNVIISVTDVCKWLGVDFFSKGPVSATEFSKLMTSNTPTKRVHWAKDVGDLGTPRRVKRVKLIDESKTEVSKETECEGKSSAPAPKSGSQKNENKFSKQLNNRKKSIKPSEAVKKKKSTQQEAEDSQNDEETSTNDHVKFSEGKENEDLTRSKSRRSASKMVSFKSMFDDDSEEDEQSDGSDLQYEKKKSLSKDERIKLIDKVNPPYLQNFDMGDTPKKMYRPFICSHCHAGYISTVKGLLHKLMEHDPRSNLSVQLMRCDSDGTSSSEYRQNCEEDKAMGVTSPKRVKLPKPRIQEKSPKKQASPEQAIAASDDEEIVNSPEAAVPEKSDADHPLSKTSIEINATNSCTALEIENNASKTIHSPGNDSQTTDSLVTDKSINGEKFPAMSAESCVNDPADSVKDDAEVSVSKESNCTSEAHSTHQHQVDASDSVSQTTSKEKTSEMAKKSTEEKSSVDDSNSDSENTLDTVKQADESTEEVHEECVTKPCIASDKAIEGSSQENTNEVSKVDEINSEDSTEKNVEENSEKDTEKDSDEVHVNTDSQESTDEVPEDGEKEATIEGTDEDSMKDADEDSVKDADEDSVKDGDEDSVRGADEDLVRGVDQDSVKGAGEDSVKGTNKDSATDAVEESEKGSDDDSEKGGDGGSVNNRTLKESVNESYAGDGKSPEKEASKVIEAAGTDTTVEGADETSEDNTDQSSEESAKKRSGEIVDEVAEVPKQVPEELNSQDTEFLSAC